jgi:hypothetical protein
MSHPILKKKGPVPYVVPGDVVLQEVPNNKVGRPSKFTKKLGDMICEQLARGLSLRSVNRDNDWCPSLETIFSWFRKYPQFLDQYARAKAEGADALVDEIQDIADDGTNDWMERFAPNGRAIGWEVNGEAVQRSKLRVDTRKWIASKLKPKKYGDHLDVTSDGKPLPTPIYGGKSTEET